ncbi:universal stress protein [Salinibaculum rarum]|uniref:universal stress protein n=1 Tax=Salinibaculum rarum TaxID=3058903 RepID=UPI00265F7493|nr:universal stress protein [Salinibaculum sp. KK48]
MGGVPMTFFVPFDGSDLAVAALRRADTLAAGTGAEIIVATIVPRDRDYAVEHGWVDDDESFETDAVETRLREQVAEIAPAAEFRCTVVQSYVSAGNIATHLRDLAIDVAADVVFLGSENVGSIAAPVSSIGSNVATRVPYDIYLVQSRNSLSSTTHLSE